MGVLLVMLGVGLIVAPPSRRQSPPGPVTEEGDIIPLPEPVRDGGVAVERALQERRSVRSYRDAPLTMQAVGQLLWAAQGITDPRGYRTAPSAGALYPLEIYLVVGQVEGLAPGVYHYLPEQHGLAHLLEGDQREALAAAALGQSCVRRGAVSLVFGAVYERTTGRYGQRGRQYVHMEVGHAAQNVYLQAASLGLGTVVVGAFDDGTVAAILRLPRDEAPLYIMPVGPI